ncbi:MAG: peptide chain release factor N(5)-glutamine methyltransferase [Acidimicrobiales bacterium]
MVLTIRDAIDRAVERLRDAGVDSPQRDAEEMAAFALGVGRHQLDDLVELAGASARFEALVEQRAQRVPLQHLVGRVRFRSIELLVGPGVFVPQPETESVVAWAVDALARSRVSSPLVVDLCTGSGTIALAVANETPGARVHAVEKDPSAVEWTRRNAAARAAAGDATVTVHLGDAADALPELDGSVDMVLSNPPYVAAHELDGVAPEVRDHDPLVALMAGHDGLDLVRIVERSARRLLRPGGLLVIEHSDRQGATAPALLEAVGGWREIADHTDADGLDRFVTARWSPSTGGRRP